MTTTTTQSSSSDRLLEISLKVDGEAAEVVAEVFNRYNHGADGVGGAVIEVQGWDDHGQLVDPIYIVRTYLAESRRPTEQLERIKTALDHLSVIYPIPEPEIRELSPEDWAEVWKRHYQPLRVGKRVVIKPSWHSFPARPDAVIVELDPGMAFGTGLHPTTQLCLAALEDYLLPGDAVLDIGTGSGILAIAAARLGAVQVWARDIDPQAVRVAQENVERNGVANIVYVDEGGLPTSQPHVPIPLPTPTWRVRRTMVEPEVWDVVVVNILPDVITEMLRCGLGILVGENGHLILSGIIEHRRQEVRDALDNEFLDVVEERQNGDWLCIIAQARPL